MSGIERERKKYFIESLTILSKMDFLLLLNGYFQPQISHAILQWTFESIENICSFYPIMNWTIQYLWWKKQNQHENENENSKATLVKHFTLSKIEAQQQQFHINAIQTRK